MLDALLQISVFTAKALIILAIVLLFFAGLLAIISWGKEKIYGRITIKNLNEKFEDIKESLLSTILPKETLKQQAKEKKRAAKAKKKSADHPAKNNIFVLHFQGDIKASAVNALREEVSAILSIANKQDEVVVCLESAGGVVHGYGLAAAQLQRIRTRDIPLTVIVDKVAASGGYMMAAIANKILAAPFAIIGSIGVIVQLPNFHRLLKDKHIDFEQFMAGNFKRTVTVFGENTEEGRKKMQEEITEIHDLFKNLIQEHRPQLNIEKVATGEHWLGTQAFDLKLVDGLQTSDDYLLTKSENSNLYEIKYVTKKSLGEKLSSSVRAFKTDLFSSYELI